MKNEKKITDAEFEVMKTVWENVMPVTSVDIVRTVKQRKGWEDTTIYTLISRLVKKGYLLQNKQKTVSSYAALISEHEYTKEQTDELIDKLFGGDAKQLISSLYETKKIKPQDIEELRRYWNGGTPNE
ncbi:BlaI/MecI/CopY family transcriptional regulator [Lacrimispora brassicae]